MLCMLVLFFFQSCKFPFQSPLHWAAKHGKPEVIKLLCGTHYVDVNARSVGAFLVLIKVAFQSKPKTYLYTYLNFFLEIEEVLKTEKSEIPKAVHIWAFG